MSMQQHHDILGPTVGKRRNENGSPPINHGLNRIDEPLDLVLFRWVISSTVRPFNEQYVGFDGLSTAYQRRIPRVEVPCQQDGLCGCGDVKHGRTWDVTRWKQFQRPRTHVPRFVEFMGFPRIECGIDVSLVPSERVTFNGTDLVAISPHHVRK